LPVTTVAVSADLLPAARDLAARAPTPLVWLLADDAEADDATLPALEAHAPGPAASLAVGADGEPVVALLGRFSDDEDALVDAASAACVPLRHIAVTSLLLETALVAAEPGPDVSRYGAYAGAEWTARLFRRRPGTLVCASTVTVRPPRRPSWRDAARMARSGAWRRGEVPGELYRALVG
jgi:hypothetical protein